MIVNLTPHSITLRAPDGAEYIYPSTGVARVSSTPGALANIGLPVPVASATVFGEIVGLPAAELACGCGAGADCPGVHDPAGCPHYVVTYYVVSALVGAALRASGSMRADVLCPGTGPNDGAIRNDAGHIVAVTRLVRP